MSLAIDSFSQEKWNLEKCIEYAIVHNLDLKQSNIQSEINKETYHQSKRNLLPYASLSSNASNSYGRSLDYTSYEYVNTTQFYSNFSFSGGIDLFRGFSKRNTISFQKMNYLAGLEDEKQFRFSIAFEVMQAYFNTVYFHELIDLVREQKELSELNLKQTQKQIELGLKAKSDLLEMESRLAKEELLLIQTQNLYQSELLNLKQVMNLKYDENFGLDFENPTYEMFGKSVINPDEVFSSAQKFYPALQAQDIRKNAALKYLSITRGNLWPRLSMGAGTATNFAALKDNENTISFQSQFKNNAYQYVGISLSIPLFEQFNFRSNVKKARLNVLQAETEFEKTNQQLFNEIHSNVQEMQSFLSEYQQLQKQVEFALFAYEAAEKKMAQGLINVIEFYDSKNILAQAKSDLLRTKLQYIIKEKTIDFYLGKTVFKTEL